VQEPALHDRGKGHTGERSMPVNSKITSPEKFFGFRLGSDRKMARWDRIVEYFYLLEKESDCIKVVEMGKSTEGNPFMAVFISSADNLANLEHYRQVNAKIADPRGIPEHEIKELIKEGKAVVCQTMSLHATEIGGTQMAPELAYDLLACESDDNLCILNNVISIIVPSFNPDGQIMVTDWYNKCLGTEYEGTGLPWLYHKYAGHDNNRDAFAQNLVESRYVAKLLLTDWHPQAYQDHHHMGSYGARLYLAPYSDGIRPHADPLVWREDEWFGAHMAYTLEEHGKTGILNGAQYPGWGHYGFHWLTTHHNIAGMLTESASAKLATPLYIHPHQLRGASPKTMPTYEAQTNFPHPWPGGWWRLRDIVEQQKIAAWALLDICAKYKEKVLWNAYLKAKRQTERGAKGTPVAYAIRPCQHDPLTALKLVNLMLLQGLEVKEAKESFQVAGRVYPKGTYIVSLDQPKMGVAKNLLGRTFYPDNYWTRNPDGSPIMYDTATDTIGEFMGVEVLPIEQAFEADLEVITSVPMSVCQVQEDVGYYLDSRFNDSFLAVNRLLKHGAKVSRVGEPVEVTGEKLGPGAFYIENGPGILDVVGAISKDLGVRFIASSQAPVEKTEIKNLRVGMYQRYYGGNMDEGWTRLLLEKFEFPYVTIRDEDIKPGNLNERFDVLILPSDRSQMILGTDVESESRERGRPMPPVPPEYRSGIGQEGAQAIKDFVNRGGRLVALDGASDFAIETLGLKVKNVVANTTWKDFYCHGSTLHANVCNRHPLAYGMPEEALVLNFDSPTFQITEAFSAEKYEIVAQYPHKDLLQSGWIIGEQMIAGKPCMLSVKVGDGQAVLIGFRTQFRSQTHGTFKFLFNCLF
jgi:hypothetical protein